MNKVKKVKSSKKEVKKTKKDTKKTKIISQKTKKVKQSSDVKYYSLSNILSRHYNINMVCGDRFGGKSTACQKYVIKRAIHSHYNSQFAILVRYDKDRATLCKTYFDNTMMMFYPEYELKYEKSVFYMKKKKDKEWHLVGHCFALNMATKYKSTSYPLIDTMILEEFLNIENKYIISNSNPELEVELLLSIYNTIARGNGKQYRDNVKVFCISNNYYLNNPYFRYYNLVDRIIQSPFQSFYECKTEPKCIVEMTHNDLKLNMSRDEIAKGGKFAEMNNEIKYAKNFKIKTVYCQLSIDNKTFYNIGIYNDSLLFYRAKNRVDDLVCYSCCETRKYDIYYIDEFWSEPQAEALQEMFNKNQLYFDSLSSYTALYSILNYSNTK